MLAQIGLGSNLGDRNAILDAAIGALAGTHGIEVVAVSAYHETPPIGGPEGQGPFLNAAATLSTSLSPIELHQRMKLIEHHAGRVRVVRWGERTLDLDLLLFGDWISSPDEELQVPHPRFALRRFVLEPLAEIAPLAIDPFTGLTVKALLANLDRRPLMMAFHGETTSLIDGLSQRLPVVTAITGLKPTAEQVRSDHLFAMTEHDLSSWFDLLTSRVQRLDRQRWLPSNLGRSWLVTDAWPDLDLTWELVDPDHPLAETLLSLPAFKRFRETRARAVLPSFLVVPRGKRRSGIAKLGGWTRLIPSIGSIPQLELSTGIEASPGSSNAHQGVEEIIAACSAFEHDKSRSPPS